MLRILRELRAITKESSLPAFNRQSDHGFGRPPEFFRDFWSGPSLASDNIGEHYERS